MALHSEWSQSVELAMTKLNATIGFYGKLPMTGDFVSRRLPNEFINPWDNWLQKAITASHIELADAWLNSYLTSPIWRFFLSPNVCGPQAVAGIMMPSVDKIGRYFPLTLAATFAQTPPWSEFFSSQSVWFKQLEDIALKSLDDSLDLNGFDQLLQNISADTASAADQPIQQSENLYFPISANATLSDAFIACSEQLLVKTMPSYSLWGNAGSEFVNPALFVFPGLPPIDHYARLLKDCTDPKLNENTLPHAPPSPVPTTPSYWQSWAFTDTGKRRLHNEDAVLNRPEAHLWAVADGMGGHEAGNVASQLIVDSLSALSAQTPLAQYAQAVESCLQRINSELRELAWKEYHNQIVGSTVVVLLCEAQYCAFLWAGDSRLYRLRNRQLHQLTQDHCAEDDNFLSDWSVKSTNVITRAVGADTILDVDMATTDLQDADVFLLCSDGLDKELSIKEIEHIMLTHPNAEIANVLMQEALARGARDNVSVIVVAQQADS